MYFLQNQGDTYRTGRFKAPVGAEAYLVEFDFHDQAKTDAPPLMPFEVVTVAEIALDCDEHGRHWNIFANRAALDAWIDWLDTPIEPEKKVVALVK